MEIRRYILNPEWSFRGWRLLPYAAQSLYVPETEFFGQEDWDLFSVCNARTDIDWDALTDAQRNRYEHWEINGFIRRARNGDRLRPEQEYRFYPARFKQSVQWSITGRCNCRCRHCFMSAPHAAQGEPSLEQLVRMLDAFGRCGIKCVNLTGGEPMVRRDFWELVDEIRARNILIPKIYSNGLLVTDAFLDGLERRGLRPDLRFSFDGAGYHDWMRGVPGAEKTVLDAIRRCTARGIRTDVTMVVFRDNRHAIRETANLLASLGCAGLKTGMATPAGEWKQYPEHYMTQAELYEAYLDYIPQYFEDGCPLSLSLDGFFVHDNASGEQFSPIEKDIPEESFGQALMCGHARRELYVSPKGNVLPCMGMVGGPIEEQFPNMLEEPLEEILDAGSCYMDAVNFRVGDFMEHNPECRTCEYRTKCCGGCRAQAVFAHPTDYLAKDPVTCEYYLGGWMERKNELLSRIGRRQDGGDPPDPGRGPGKKTQDRREKQEI